MYQHTRFLLFSASLLLDSAGIASERENLHRLLDEH